MATKIFVFGSIHGQLEAAFVKLAALHAKNNFSFAIVTGNLFAEGEDDSSEQTVTALLEGRIAIPCPTYFTVGTCALPKPVVQKIENDEEIAPNLHYLGKRSVTKTSDGVRIVVLGGILDTTIVGGQSKEQHLPFHSLDDAKALRGANSTDILLTALWPVGVWKGSSIKPPTEHARIPATEAIADLCAALRPRYHFCMSPDDFFYEREPFFHPRGDDSGQPSTEVTRFISLAPFGNAAKAKAMYAFTLQQQTPASLPPGSTLSPFARAKKRPADEAGTYSRFSNGNTNERDHRRKRKRERSPPPGPDRCFFCLSNPNLSTHMVCSIGDDCYVATAKGPLPSNTTYKNEGLHFPGHMVIVPLTHAPTVTIAAMGETDAKKTFKEMSRYREALQAMVSSQTKRKVGAVTFEINRARGIHAHWQFIPVPALLVRKGLVEAAFKVEAENLKLPKFEEKDFGIGDELEGDFFRVWIWAEQDDNDGGADGGKIINKSLVLRFDEGVRFDLQFGRRVLAKLLGLDKRLVWQDVAQTEEEETADARAFQKAFKPWDFTLEEAS
ncbi:hypothetical protein VTK73DRAFT_1644 [Phialemonium thermophilum]|uniref:Uncharacterized protein n=1 Tax=Phialemonium thermophilum TaxID=223376 RepID=A0ABR3X9F8_9PEZI